MVHIWVLWSRNCPCPHPTPQPCVSMGRLLPEAAVFLEQMAQVTKLRSNSRDDGRKVNEPQATISLMKVWRIANGCQISLWNNFSKTWFFFSFGIKKCDSYKPKIAIKILWEHLLCFIDGHHAGPWHKDSSLLGTSTEEFKKLNWSQGFSFLLLNSFNSFSKQWMPP